MKQICVVTGSRAEFGLLLPLLRKLDSHPRLQLELVITGSHLDPRYGYTLNEVHEHFSTSHQIDTLLSSNSRVSISKSIAVGVLGFSDYFANSNTDLIIILGDRFEIFAAAIAALPLCIPIAHLHGGEVTTGSLDDSIRHSLTKLSHVHFVACTEYRDRVIQLGEDPSSVHIVGGLGIDAISELSLLSRDELESSLGINFSRRNLLITFHPAILDGKSPEEQMSSLLSALAELSDTTLIFTLPNADSDGQLLAKQIAEFTFRRKNAYSFSSLGQLRYLSCMQHVDGVVGNSSSGLLEAPSLGIGTIDIGSRQAGRLKASSVIECKSDKASILEALVLLYSPTFQKSLDQVINPYGKPGASTRILRVIEELDLSSLIPKTFYDQN